MSLQGDSDSMDASELSVGLIFLSLTMIGILGNFLLLYHHLFLYLTRHSIRSTDWILRHLIVANILTLLFKGVPHTIAAFGLTDFLNDTGCKLVFSFHRIGRGVCIGSTSFLSVFQAILISPRNYRHSEVHINSHKCIYNSVYLNWVSHCFLSSIYLIDMRSKHINESTEILKSFLYCYAVCHDQTSDILSAILLSFPDTLFLGLMLWASGSMVVTLYRHKKRMQNMMPRTNISSRSSPESRATTTILLLVSTFVSFYTISSLCHFLTALKYFPSWYLTHGTAMAALFFPTACPFLLISRDSLALSYLLPLKMKRHFLKACNQELNGNGLPSSY